MFTSGVEAQLSVLAKLYPGISIHKRRHKAMRLLTRLAGAILIARAVDDPQLAHDLLASARLPELAHEPG